MDEDCTPPNAPPTLGALSASSPIDENSTATLTGSFSDPDAGDSHVLTVNWGDGTSSSLAAAPGTFSLNHQYLDDNPTATASDVYSISVSVCDSAPACATGSTTVTVNNVNPTLTLDQASANNTHLQENGIRSLSGTISDPGTLDTFTLVVDWGEGSPETIDLAAGSTSFSLSHQYLDDDPTGTPVDEYAITLTLTDDDTSSATAGTYARVYDVAPTVDVPALVLAHENETATITGAISDPGTMDTFTLEVDWGDGSVETYSYTAGTTTFSVGHTYLDDDPSGTPYDDYPVSLTVTDDDTLATTAGTTVRVYNVDPSVTVVASGPVSEGDSTTVTGVISDPGTLDTFVLTISWGDGSNQSMTLSAGSTSFSASHTYVDDDPSGTPWDNYAIAVAATDDDTGVGSAATFVTVENVAPSLGDLSVASPIVEGDVATLSSTWADPGAADTFALVVDWGDGTSDSFSYGAGATSFSESHRYLDDDPSDTPSDSYTITATLTDDDTGDDSATATVVVNNVDPALSGLTVTSSVGENGIAVLSGTISDPGTLDTFAVLVDWGDGTSDSYGYPAGVTSFAESHRYLDDDPSGTAWDTYTIGASVGDDDTGASETRTANVTVYNTPPGVDELAVTGPIDENGAATLTGKIVDPGTQDGLTLFIDWGDGASGFYPYDLQTRAFSHTHQYLDDDPSSTPSDEYTISVTVTDDDEGTSTTTTSVVVQNVDPSLGDVVATSPIDEDGTATVTGTISDPGTLDSFTLVIDWGDGASDTYSYAAGTSSFSESHQYLDDDPTATAADDYTIALSLADDDTGSATATATLTVQNLDPADLTLTLSAGSINENDTVTLGGSFSDAGTRDTHKVVIDWGDGSPTTTLDLAVGVMSFNADHKYLDDNPTATIFDNYTITVRVSDDDGGADTEQTTVTVHNVAPSLTGVPLSTTVFDEATPVTVTLDKEDPALIRDDFTLHVDWGNGEWSDYELASSNIPFTISHRYPDDDPSGTPGDDYIVDLVLCDDDGGCDSEYFTARVRNGNPYLSDLAASTPTDEMHTTMFTGKIDDPGDRDTFTLLVDWGDGTSDTYSYAAGTKSFTESHAYGMSLYRDRYTIAATLTDDDTESMTGTVSVLIVADVKVTERAVDSTSPSNDGFVLVGGTIDYTISVDNLGSSAATNIVVNDDLPAGVTIAASGDIVPSQGLCTRPSATTIRCDLGTLLVSQSATIFVRATVTATGVLTNSVSAAASMVDLEASNNHDSVTLWAIRPRIHQVEFSGDHTVIQDNGSAYMGADWLDANDDGDGNDAGDHRFPIAYTRSQTVQISGARFLMGTDVTMSILVRGTGDFTFGPVTVSVSGDKATATGLAASSPLPGEVRFYNPLNIDWEISFDGGASYYGTGTSDNRIYVTLRDPVGGYRHETLYHVGSSNAQGATDEHTVIANVWGDFTDRDVRRKPIDGFNATDNHQLTYYASYLTGNLTTPALLAFGDGQCGSWARFFLDILKVQGVDQSGDFVLVRPSDASEGFLVNDWTFSGAGVSGDVDYPFLNIPDAVMYYDTHYGWRYSDVSDDAGAPGQGTSNPASMFGNHQFVFLGGVYYDPSYGVTCSDLLDFDDNYLAGYFVFDRVDVDESTVSRDLNGDGDTVDVAVPVDAVLVRRNIVGTLEVFESRSDY